MQENKISYKILIALISFIIFNQNSFAQEYGLEFLGHEVVSDKRTALFIGENHKICPQKNIELDFEIKFKPKVSSYFGYVFRIIDEDNKNIDLLFQSDSKGKSRNFRIISGEKDIKLEKHLDSISLYSKWNFFKILIHENELQIICNDKVFGKGKIPFVFKKCFKIYFGECTNPNYLTSDVLPMYLRNVILKNDGKTIHHWPLNEIYGNTSIDLISRQQASAKNPQWILKNHFEWKLLKNFKFKGNSSFTFDKSAQKIVVNSDLKTFFFNTKNDSLIFKKFDGTHQKFTFGDMAVFLPKNQKLINVRLNEKQIFNYDLSKNIWNISPNEKFDLTEYWHHNKYIFPEDSAIVFMGGYGQYKYKNSFQKFVFGSKKWTNLDLSGDKIEPRYMFGLGNKNAIKSYIFGGFGSKNGDQGMNPHNYYDLFEIDWKTNNVKKIYELSNTDSTYVVAPTLILNKNKDTFYGLIYNQMKFNSCLQLIEGSLTNPAINRIAKEIPYKFIDVSSYADLYFNESNSKLYCVTSFFSLSPVDSTEISIYSLDFPPTNLPEYSNNTQSTFSNQAKILIIILFFVIVVAIFILYFYYKNQINLANKVKSIRISEVNTEQIITDNKALKQENILNEEPVKGKVLLFGGFQFINNKGQDLTSQFSPLLKEMFLYLLLNSIKWNKGVSSPQLNEMFWNDKTTSSARNNRSVNITKLKSIFEQLPAIQISKDTGNWKILFEKNEVFIDYYEFRQLTNSKKILSSEEIKTLTSIVNQGSFLSNLEYEWLDDFKGEISNNVIDAYLVYSEKLSINEDSEEIIEIADNIFKFDSVDETAMALKCKALVHLGKHSLAKSSYEKFSKDYQRLYSEEYAISYKDILES